ncbi:uncharacterized protein LOC136079791 isoform X2 [Hydra vulgaris]|uniref:Uncharacterized protein LOC136079791 isoform X2 n=1 Tax=Hydra vulgaris TaxID=6087 RepID=A0ABM4BSZ1_HYDVU
MKSENYAACYFLLIISLRNIITQYSYPAQKSLTGYSVTVFKEKRVDNITDIVEIHTNYKQCVAACYRKNSCKSIDAEILNNSALRCRFFNLTSPNVQLVEGFLFISMKPPNCSLSCSLTLNPCGECKCHPSCAGRNRRPYICNCTNGIKKTCQDHYNDGFNKTGIYQISPNGSVFETVCEMDKVEQQNPKVTNPICYLLKSNSLILSNSSVSYCVVTCANLSGIDTMFFSRSFGCLCGHKQVSSLLLNTQFDYCTIDSSSKNCILSKVKSNQLIGYDNLFSIGYISWGSCVSFCVDYQQKNPTQNGYVASFIADVYGDCQCFYGFSGQKISFNLSCLFYETIPPTALPKIKVNERVLTFNNLVATLTSLKKTYSVSFKFYLKSLLEEYRSVIHLTIGSNVEQYGDRCPAVWVISGQLFICSAINGDKNSCITTYQLPLNAWSAIKISQINQNEVYKYIISINETVVYSIINTVPQSFSNVYVYSADPWHASSNDSIKDLKIINENDIETSDPVEQKLINGNLNATLSFLGKTYSVSFKVKPRSYSQGWKSVIHLTIGGSWGRFGDRCPAVWFYYDGSGRLYISAAVNEDYDYIFTTQPLPLNQWSSLQISQFQINGIYMYTVYLNELLVHSIVNKKPQSFSNVKVYTGNPWSIALNGSIKDLKITGGRSEIWIPMMTRFSNWESSFWNRSYESYENGFGLINQQWIGLEKLYQITNTFFTDMRVDYFFEDSITFSTMYYNVNIGSSEDSYVLSYESYDPRDSFEPDRLNANGITFKSCSKWWTNSCNEYVSPTSSHYISYGSTENLLSIQFFLRTNEIK